VKVDKFNGLRIGSSDRTYEKINEPSTSGKGGEFLDQQNEYHLLKKDSA
jgi:hypothetical protein